MTSATMTGQLSSSPSSRSLPGEIKLESLGDAMKLLDQLLAKIPPSEAPALIEAALAKRKEFALEPPELGSSMTTQEPASVVAVEADGSSGGEDDEEHPPSEEELIESLARSGLLSGIPLREGDGRAELSRLSNHQLSPITAALLRRGYDIRLGEKGRSDLKQEISRRIREVPELKEK